ncbi:MAG TPA: SRPBCC domain-containing protein [Actinomycetota bacterium]|nr:SRPBCC domain-containing protein [Actinomycetota bacterium]
MAFTEDLRAEVVMDATPEEVWGSLMAFAAYPDWNPFVVAIEGEATVGAKLRVRLQPPGGKGSTFRPTVIICEPGRVFSWLGRVVVNGIFDGAHRFELTPAGDGRTRFVQSEHFRGLLVPLFRRSLRTHTLAGFEAMNRALADRVKASA